MEWVWLILAWLILAVAMVGCLLPIIPGPPIAYGAVLLMDWAGGWAFGLKAHALILVAIVAVTILDFVVPTAGAKRFGASKAGTRMSIVGMLVGLIWFPPFGLLLGAAIGAFVGEIMNGKREREALKAAWGVLIGTIAGIVLKLIVVIWIGVWIS